MSNGIDWLNAHHFDYHGLIEKGIAIKVTKENNHMKDFKLDEYHMFMNKHVLNPIGVDYYGLLKRGLAFNFE